MKINAQILNLVLACALLVLAVKVTFDSKHETKNESGMESNAALDVIMTRTSIRAYTDKPVTEAQTDTLLRAAMAAPTAGNKQPWAYVAVTDKAVLKQLSDTMPYGKMIAQAPLAIVVCGNTEKGFTGIETEYWIQDASAASQNILLAAHAMGLGAVWTGVYPVPERVKRVKEVLDLPATIIPLSIIPVGYPAEEGKVKNKYKTDNIHYNKW